MEPYKTLSNMKKWSKFLADDERDAFLVYGGCGCLVLLIILATVGFGALEALAVEAVWNNVWPREPQISFWSAWGATLILNMILTFLGAIFKR